MIELVFGFGLMSPWKREVYCVDREGNKIEEPLS
jgi:hypothetical protein